MARKALLVLSWACLLVLGAFGIVFSFANYPLLAIGLVLLVLLVAGYAERTRRTEQRARETARTRARASRERPQV